MQPDLNILQMMKLKLDQIASPKAMVIGRLNS